MAARPRTPTPTLELLVPVVRVLAGGRRRRAGAAAATGAAAAAGRAARDRLMELCCLLLRALCAAHPTVGPAMYCSTRHKVQYADFGISPG